MIGPDTGVMAPFESDRVLRRRAGWQMGYLVLFALFVLGPNLRGAPSLILITATALAALWLVGGLTVWVRLPRADELLLCGSAAPLLVGLTQLAYRMDFLRVHGALTRPGAATDSAVGFLAVWAAELLLVLLPGLLFVWLNARSLAPLQPNRPESANKRT